MRRVALLIGGWLLLWSVVALATGPGRSPASAQDDGFPTVGPFPTVGEFQTVAPFTPTVPPFATAGAVATVPPSPGTLRVVAPEDGGGVALAGDVAVELILDNSGSMLQPLGNELRIDVAKRVLTELVEETLPPGIPMALRVFGDEPDSCETSLAIRLQPLDPEAAAEEIAEIQSINLVKTPIGAALELVAEDLAEAEGPKIVVLVTDGEETCGGDPERAIRDLIEAGIDVRVNIVGFAVEDEALKEQFEAWARLGGGRYFDATGAEELGAAIAEALQPPFVVRDADGEVVRRGVVGGEAVRLPVGTYTVEVRSDPPQTFEDVEVGSGDNVRLTLEGEE